MSNPRIGITLRNGADPQQIMARILEISGVAEIVDISKRMGVLRQLSNTETWEERCAREALENHGLTDASEISRHIDAAQSDLDYLIAQDETLERLVQDARDARGTSRDRSEIIAAALEDAGVGPDEDEELDAQEDDGPQPC